MVQVYPDTPAMRQYRRFKEQHPDCVLFFRMGDFYEMFFDDAKLAHKVLGVTLTQRSEGIPMAGVPFHSVENYLRRMIHAGYRVAVCDQMEEAAQAKGVVRRDVTRVITPGTLTDESLLEEGTENPLAAVMFHDDSHASLAWTEFSTGDFRVASLAAPDLADELARIAPRELLFVETANHDPPPRIKALITALACAVTPRPAWQFRQNEAVETLCKQFQVASLAGFGFPHDDPALGPASAIIHYLLETQRSTSDNQPAAVGGPKFLSHLRPPRRFERINHLVIDQISLRSLEVERTARSGSTEGSLLGTIQDCRTAMGRRLLRQWLCYPLRDLKTIESRQRVVAALIDDSRFLDELRAALDHVQDVPRMVGRAAIARATPRDLVALGQSCLQAKTLAHTLDQRPSVADYHQRLASVAAALESLGRELTRACVDSPPPHLRDGGLIRDGYDVQLDNYRGLQRDSNTWLAQYQKQLIDQTAIPSLKVGYNKIFGFYIELTATHKDKAPAGWARKQTLKNAERFITQELKEYETRVLSADQKAIAREQELFAQFCADAARHADQLHAFAQAAAELDVMAGFARRAVRFRYTRPTLVPEPVLHLKAARHPVLDEILGDKFVPNDVDLGAIDSTPETRNPEQKSASLALITGPNMAGKSTYIRQTALIVLLAHTGSFVPADQAVIGLTDRIFTRIGASDELHAGASTFMVEMTETANICHHATSGSLVILDEIGRGTSTLDGLSLAWAIAEHLAGRGPRTLFATHYHELTALAERFSNVVNLNVTVREWADQIVFLHRIAPGKTDRSYGIHVAKIAGLPPEVVARANQLLGQLEVSHNATDALAPAKPPPQPPPGPQMSLFTQYLEHPALDSLRKADLNALNPIQAFDLLRKLKEQAEDQQD